MTRIAELERVLALVVAALDDAIAHNVNATEHDSAGWTQDDYDVWDQARETANALLAGGGGSQGEPE